MGGKARPEGAAIELGVALEAVLVEEFLVLKLEPYLIALVHGQLDEFLPVNGGLH